MVKNTSECINNANEVRKLEKKKPKREGQFQTIRHLNNEQEEND